MNALTTRLAASLIDAAEELRQKGEALNSAPEPSSVFTWTEVTLAEKIADATVRVSRLSRRERDVLRCLVTGLSNKGVGQALGISDRTVEIHRANLMQHLSVQSLAESVAIWIYANLATEVTEAEP